MLARSRGRGAAASLLTLSVFTVTAGMVTLAIPRAASAQAPAAHRKRLAVMNFDFGTVQHWWGGGSWDVGKGIADLLVTSLVKDGSYSMIERKSLDSIMAEQNLGNSDRADPQTAAKLGRLLGANALITGSVTQFGFDDKSIGLGGIGSKIGGGLFGNLKKQDSKATVVVDARIIDATTGEILAVASGKGESKRGSWGGFGGGWNSSGSGAGGIDMNSSNFQDTILGEATRKCVEQLAEQLVKDNDKITFTRTAAIGKVADVDGKSVTVTLGEDRGITVGDELVVERVMRTIKDPDTGSVIREVTQPVGKIKVTEVDKKSSTGTFTGSGVPKAGDRVKN